MKNVEVEVEVRVAVEVSVEVEVRVAVEVEVSVSVKHRPPSAADPGAVARTVARMPVPGAPISYGVTISNRASNNR